MGAEERRRGNESEIFERENFSPSLASASPLHALSPRTNVPSSTSSTCHDRDLDRRGSSERENERREMRSVFFSTFDCRRDFQRRFNRSDSLSSSHAARALSLSLSLLFRSQSQHTHIIKATTAPCRRWTPTTARTSTTAPRPTSR